MALNDDIRTLTGAGLLSGLSTEHLRLLAFGAETLRLHTGRELYREGERADSAYVVSEGTIALYLYRDGDRIPMGQAGPGSMLGELALISDLKRLTDAAAEGDAVVMRINRVLFRRILDEYPDVARRLHRRIAADLQSMMGQIERLAPRFR